jgi:hypothetical protein
MVKETRSESLKVRITPTLKLGLTKLAEKDHRSLAAYVELLLIAHLEQMSKRK